MDKQSLSIPATGKPRVESDRIETKSNVENTFKDALYLFIDELARLREDAAQDRRHLTTSGNKPRAVNVDHGLRDGAARFMRFHERVKRLDQELQILSNAVRQLGSSVRMISSAFHVQARLSQILHLFQENAADLFPDIKREQLEPVQNLKNHKNPSSSETHKPSFAEITSNPERLPEELESLSTELQAFIEALKQIPGFNQVPEFTIDAVNSSISSFHTDLKYWASCLHDFQGQFRTPSIQRYMDDLTEEMEIHLEGIAQALVTFSRVGVPTIKVTQKHTTDTLQNLSTVATFFSAVTATMIQYSYESAGTATKEAVNIFWLTSLVFSVASAINSQLAYHWSAAIYSSPPSQVPWWVSIWITQTPLVFLVASVTAFSMGLVCFTFANFPSTPLVPIFVTICTCVSSFALFSVGCWFAGDRYAFRKNNGSKWLVEELEPLIDLLNMYSGSQWISNHGPIAMRRTKEWLKRTGTEMVKFLHSVSVSLRRLSLVTNVENGRADIQVDKPDGLTHDAEFPPNYKYKTVVQKLIRIRRGPTPDGSPLPFDARRQDPNVRFPQRGSRLRIIEPTMYGLKTPQYLYDHTALVRHLQFSPNGEFLATCSWDGTAIIWKVADPFHILHKLVHPRRYVTQVAWARDSRHLLTRMIRVVKVWDIQTGDCLHTIDRGQDVQSITWMPNQEAFVSVEDDTVHIVNLDGTIKQSINLGDMRIRDVAVTPDEQRLLAVATLWQSPNGLTPSKSRSEKRIIVFNLQSGSVENRIPTFDQVLNVSLSASGTFALVSYAQKSPPQLFKFETIKGAIRLSPVHKYTPPNPIVFAGPSHFGRISSAESETEEQLVISAGEDGLLHIWERETAKLIYSFQAQDDSSQLASVAWNHASEKSLMFATAAYDGTIRIWTAPWNGSSSGPNGRRRGRVLLGPGGSWNDFDPGR